jgi:tetratricopeptide (TPR) repeat protein
VINRIVLTAVFLCSATAGQTEPEQLIEAGHWKRARTLVETRIRETPGDALANFLLSQVRNAFGDPDSPLPLAEKAVSLDGRTARYHRQVAECVGVMAQHSSMVQQVFLARRFRKEIDAALALDPRDTQAWRDLMEFYLLAPGIIGGDLGKAAATADHLRSIDRVEGLLAQSRLASFRKQNNEAEALLRRATEVQPPSYKARVALGRFYLCSTPPAWDAVRKSAEEARALDAGRVDAYAILAEVHAARSEWVELDAILAAGAKEVPDDFVPFYRAAERLLASGRDLPRAERYLNSYLSQPPEGNQPSVAEARAKLAAVLEKQGRTGTRAAAYLTIEPKTTGRPN